MDVMVPNHQAEEKETKPTKGNQKRLKQKQNDKTNIETTEKRVKMANQGNGQGLRTFLKGMWKDIQESIDKLYIIRRKDNSRRPAEWHLVQVDLDETNERQARKIGEYRVKYYIRNYTDAKKRLGRNCRHWPLIREIKLDRNFSNIVVIQPNKVEETLSKRPYTHGWYQDTMNLAENGLIGPLNFSSIQGETYRVHDKVWRTFEELEEVKSGEVNINDLNRIVPLPG
jgi:hypothetical protein